MSLIPILSPKKFKPSDVPGLGLWLESDWGVTRDGLNAVSSWLDRSVNGYDFTQAVGANQPIWTAGEFGGNAGLIFDGTNDSLEISVANPFSTSQSFTFFVVLKAQVNDNDENYFSMGDLGSSDNFVLYKQGIVGTNPAVTFSVLSGIVNDVRGNTAINDNISHLFISESNGSAWSERIDRINQTLTVTGANSGIAPGDYTTLDNITIGVIRRSGVFFVRSNFAAILFYTSQISTGDRSKVENYLIDKYRV